MSVRANSDPLGPFHPAVRDWFTASFGRPTDPQTHGWPPIARGESTLILAPTGSGKTLTAFLWCLDRLMFTPEPPRENRCRVVYVSPLKALAVDVERNLRAPLAGIARVAANRGDGFRTPVISIRTGDTPAAERARFQREPADILITTPESLYLMLTANVRDRLRHVDTIIVDEIHALVPTKRGVHLALSLERLAARCDRPPQRIGLSATQRPLDEVARFLGGCDIQRARGSGLTAHGKAQGSGLRAHRKAHGSRLTAHVRADGQQQAAAANARGAEVAVHGEPQHSSDEIAEEFAAHSPTIRYRPVTIVDAGARKALALRIEVPVEDMARLTTADDIPSGPASVGDTRPSIWSAIHPRLLTLIQEHRSTLIFVNSRRLSERLAGALNELAGETLVRSHHGSIAREQRADIEDRLKAGTLRALVATSSLELGIDMGAIDLVVQIEAPPTVASGLQRIGRSGHQIDAVSEGIIFPKFRGDLVACAAVVKAMHDGAVEATRYPRNPLDIVAQQIVAMAGMDTWNIDELYRTIRSAAPFADLSRTAFDGVLDMLSGRYPSDEFAELKPRLTWDRTAGTVVAREGAKRVAIANGGTIPDRGLYGVFLLGAPRGSARVGELDEEMVFESAPGETFVLGASSWRIEEITHDRVLVSPAPGQPGKTPFWRGDRAGRPLELGLSIGTLMRDLMRVSPAAALERLVRQHDLDARAAENLLQYLRDQLAATGALPDASTIVIERVRDELGDWRVCLLSPRGGRVHAPWAMAASARIREETGVDVETLWGDDGFVVRFPDVDQPPDPLLLLPEPEDLHALVVRQLGGTALFAAKFRENAGRSLLLPKRRPGMRAPLWQQRKKSADLLAVAARYGSFPVLLETYRECLRDFFDMPALVDTLTAIRSRTIRTVTTDSERPSPFAASLLFSYVASFLYDGDAPLAERRAQALAVDQAQLRELLGDAELRELLDLESVEAVERQLQRLEAKYHVRHADGLHDLLLSLGDLNREEIRARSASPTTDADIDMLMRTRRIVQIRIAGSERFVAVEDAARFRDALGTPLPQGLPEALLGPARDPIGDLLLRYARTHAPFPVAEFVARYQIAAATVEAVLARLVAENRLLEGEFRPGGSEREWTDNNVLRSIRRRALAKLRHEVEPVEQAVLGRLSTTWQGIVKRRRGVDALLDVIEQLQGAPLAASILETEILPARLEAYDPSDLDTVVAAGEVVWVGREPLGERDGRVALYLADHLPRLHVPNAAGDEPLDERQQRIVDMLGQRGASFFGPLHDAVGGGFPGETVEALWGLVWRGLVTNDTLHALRAFVGARPAARRRPHADGTMPFRSRRLVPSSAEGRWSLVASPVDPVLGDSARAHAAGASRSANKSHVVDSGVSQSKSNPPGSGISPSKPHLVGADFSRRKSEPRARASARQTTWAAAMTQQLLARHGILTREAVAAESIAGGFGAVYPVLKALEEAGRIRRGYFVAGLGATQFALPGALDLLRALRDRPEEPEVVVLSAADPGNPYGTILPWFAPPASKEVTPSAVRTRKRASKDPSIVSAGRGPTRTVGATVVLIDGALATYLARGDRQATTWLPEDEPERSRVGRALASALAERARRRGMLLEEIDGMPAERHPLGPFLTQAGFVAGAMGLQGPKK